MKGGININVNEDNHNLDLSLKSCNGFGKYNKNEKYLIFTKNPDYSFNYIDHYLFKSTKEFIDKLNRGFAHSGKKTHKKLLKINYYFEVNKITLKKINLIEKYTNISSEKNTKKRY